MSDPMGRNKMKPEQASKVRMRMPTVRSFGEGRTRGEAIDMRTYAIRRGSGARHAGKVVRSYRGRPVADEGNRTTLRNRERCLTSGVA